MADTKLRKNVGLSPGIHQRVKIVATKNSISLAEATEALIIFSLEKIEAGEIGIRPAGIEGGAS